MSEYDKEMSQSQIPYQTMVPRRRDIRTDKHTDTKYHKKINLPQN